MKKKLSHIDLSGNPAMVDVSSKKQTPRTAKARAVVRLGKAIISEIRKGEITTKKGPVFQTAILAGVMGAKRTSDLIPLCHPLGLDDCQVTISIDGTKAVIDSVIKTTGKTGVEMEALTAVCVASLTVYDMCKAMSHRIEIEEIKLIEKTGGKKDFRRK